MRKVTIINSRTQSQTVMESNATTLGQLKQEMSAKGIDYTNMTFYEGYSRTELIDDASVLPTNIPYKGQVVNDLVFQLTTTNKKIASGLYNRKELYAKIKEYNLTEVCKSKFGRNFTQCSTDNLNALVFTFESEKATPTEEPKTVKEEVPTMKNNPQECPCSRIEKVLKLVIDHFYDNDYLDEYVYNDITEVFNSTNNTQEGKLSRKEISEMFDFIN